VDTSVCAGNQQALPAASEANEQIVQDRRDIFKDQRQRPVPVPIAAQREMESGRSPLVSIPPFGRGFSRHQGLPIRSDLLKSAEAKSPRSGHRLDEPARLSLGMVASLQRPLLFRLAQSL
jgi:hypothetical protein